MEIKGDSILRQIPVVVLTTSQDKQDVIRSYTAGASSYVTKPQRFDDLVDMIGLLGKYWLEVVELPPRTPGDQHVRSTDQAPLG